MKVLCFYTETTGLPKDQHASFHDSSSWPHIIQLSYIVIDTDTKEIIEYIDRIIKLADDVDISQESINIHKITRERIRSTEKTIKDFYKTYRRLPPSFDDLQYKVLTKSKPAPKDEWGQVLVLSTTADKTSSMYRIISSGPDREMGTDDDLVVSGSAKWTREPSRSQRKIPTPDEHKRYKADTRKAAAWKKVRQKQMTKR